MITRRAFTHTAVASSGSLLLPGSASGGVSYDEAVHQTWHPAPFEAVLILDET